MEDEMVRKVYLGQNFELRKKKIDFHKKKDEPVTVAGQAKEE